MRRFDLDRGMGIRGLTGSRPTSFQYEADPIIDAIVSRQDANNSMNRATDQYEADVADFKDTIAREKEQGIAGLPNMNNLNNSPFISEGINSIIDERGINRRPFVPPRMEEQIFVPPKLPSIGGVGGRDIEDRLLIDDIDLPLNRDLIDYGYGPGIMPPTPEIFLDDMETKPIPFEPTILIPPRELPPTRDLIDYGYGPGIMPPYPPQDFEDNPFRDVFEPPFEPPIDRPPFKPPIDKPPFEPPIQGPIKPPGGGRKGPPQPLEPPIYINEPPYIPPDGPPDDIPITPPPPPPPPPPPSGPINYYTNKPINNPYTPYATDSGAPALSRRISPASFGMAPGMFPPGPPKPIVKLPRIPDGPPPDRPVGAKYGGVLNGSLNKGIMRLPQSQQGDTMTTQMFQRAFRPRR